MLKGTEADRVGQDETTDGVDESQASGKDVERYYKHCRWYHLGCQQKYQANIAAGKLPAREGVCRSGGQRQTDEGGRERYQKAVPDPEQEVLIEQHVVVVTEISVIRDDVQRCREQPVARAQ